MMNVELLKRRAYWMVSEWPYLWGGLLLALITAGVLVAVHAKQEVCIRWWGGALQLFGIVMVLRDLRGAQRQFGQDGISERVRKGFTTLPRSDAIAGLTGIELRGLAGTVRAKSRDRADPAGPIADRIRALESNFARIDSELDRVRQDLDNEAHERNTGDALEREVRAGADAQLRADLIEQAIGSYTFSMFGVVWLLVGLVLSTGSPELAKWAAAWLR